MGDVSSISECQDWAKDVEPLGANYFFAPNVKATVEWGYNFKSLTNLTPDLNNAGFRPDVAEINNPNQGNEGQWALRAQLQLLF